MLKQQGYNIGPYLNQPHRGGVRNDLAPTSDWPLVGRWTFKDLSIVPPQPPTPPPPRVPPPAPTVEVPKFVAKPPTKKRPPRRTKNKKTKKED